MRRYLIIAAGALLFILLAAGVYFFFFNKGGTGITTDITDPFGNTGADDYANNGSGTPPDVGVPIDAGDEVAPQLFRITLGPVAQGTAVFPITEPLFDQGTTSEILPPNEDIEVRYVERASGNIYRYHMRGRTLERLTNQTIPGVQEAVWLTDGSQVFLRSLADEEGTELVRTYAFAVDTGEGYFLEPNIEVAVSGTSTALLVLPTTAGSIGTTIRPDGSGGKTLFSSTLSALRVFAGGKGFVATTKASAQLPGYGFLIDERTGAFSRLIGPLPGLTVLPSPSGLQYFYSALSGGTLRTGLIDLAIAEPSILPIATFADKCVWARDSRSIYCAVPRSVTGTLPDDWYQGVFASSDRFWKIDLETRIASLVFDPQVLAQIDIDAVALTLDDKEDTLVFTNKRDGSLWLYDL